MNKNKSFKKTEGIFFSEVENEYFLTMENQDVVVCMNPFAFAVIANLDGFTAVKTISKQLAQRYKIPEEKMLASINDLIKKMLELGVLTEVDQGGSGDKNILSFGMLKDRNDDQPLLPEIIRIWQGEELYGGMFVDNANGDMRVIVPNVTEGPLKTCPPNTCTIPAGLFTPDSIIRTFDQTWKKNFEGYKRRGKVHYQKG